MSKCRSLVISLAAVVVIGAGLFAAGRLAAAGPSRTDLPTSQKLTALKAGSGIQPVAKTLGSPIAFGFVQFDGSLRSTSGNITAAWNAGKLRYEIRIAGIPYNSGPHLTFVTAEGQGGIYLPATTEDNGVLIIRIGQITGEPGVQTGFQFVTYKVS